MSKPQEYLREIAPRIDSTYRGALADAAERLDTLESVANALLHQIDRGDFVDSNGHSAKMLKPVWDMMKLTGKEPKAIAPVQQEPVIQHWRTNGEGHYDTEPLYHKKPTTQESPYTPAPVQQEPVAWMHTYTSYPESPEDAPGYEVTTFHQNKAAASFDTPLFTAPAAKVPEWITNAKAPAPAPEPEGWKRAVSLAYGHLWNINTEPMAPIPMYSNGEASHVARKLLRDLLTHDERGLAINEVRAMLGAAPQPKEQQCR